MFVDGGGNIVDIIVFIVEGTALMMIMENQRNLQQNK